jgi:hypothetical protein
MTGVLVHSSNSTALRGLVILVLLSSEGSGADEGTSACDTHMIYTLTL